MADDSVAINTTNATIDDDNEENLEEWFKTLSKQVANEQKKIRDEIKSIVLKKEYNRSFTFSKRETINHSNKSEFVRYIAENEEEIRRKKKEMKEKEKLEKEEIRRKKKETKEKENLEKEEIRRRRKFVSNFTKTGNSFIKTLYGTVKRLSAGASLSVAGLITRGYNLYDPYAKAQKYGLLVNTDKKYDNSLISRARFTPEISRESVSSELANYYEKQWHYQTRKQELNPHLHRLNLNSNASVEKVLSTIKQQYKTEPQRRQIARDVGLEDAYIASLQKKITLEENNVEVMREAKLAIKDVIGRIDDLSTLTLPLFIKTLNHFSNKYLSSPGKSIEGIANLTATPYLMYKGAKTGLKYGALAGALTPIPGGAFVGGVMGALGGAYLGYKGGTYASEKLGNYVDYRVKQENLSFNNRQSATVNSNLPNWQEVSKMKDNTTININFNGSVYNPDEITNKIQDVVQSTIDNNKINDTLYQAI